MTDSLIAIEPAIPKRDRLITQHFYQLWLDNNVPADLICDDWLITTVIFI